MVLNFRQLALEAEPHKRDGFQRNSYWMSRGIAEVTAAPHVWFQTLATKALWSVNDTEIPRNEDYRCRTQAGPLSWLGHRLVRYGWVFPLALLGAWVGWRRPQARFMVCAWATLHLPVVLFIVADRYRLATWPMMCLLVPLGIESLRRVPTMGWKTILAFVIACVIPWLPIDERTQEDPAWCEHIAGNLDFMDNDLDAAEAHYREAVRLAPSDWSAHIWLAQTLSKRGQVSEALEHVQIVLKDFPDSFPTLRTAAAMEAKRGDHAAAAELLLRAYAVPGDRTSTGVRAVKMLYRSGQAKRAEGVLSRDPKLAKRWANRR